ncbi:hypothetical protein SNEBB_003071 [Seison nebaliae]|nr:hypothetical protein SNEBB_003071 [Seison nebaliae]
MSTRIRNENVANTIWNDNKEIEQDVLLDNIFKRIIQEKHESLNLLHQMNDSVSNMTTINLMSEQPSQNKYYVIIGCVMLLLIVLMIVGTTYKIHSLKRRMKNVYVKYEEDKVKTPNLDNQYVDNQYNLDTQYVN